MITFSTGFEGRDPEQASTRSGTDDPSAGKRSRAIELTAREGFDPFSLVANTLDEEPCDGVLPLAGEAHFAWRDRLWRVQARD